MTFDDCYAHSLLGTPKEKWQPLDEHLRNVAAIGKLAGLVPAVATENVLLPFLDDTHPQVRQYSAI